jgi:hypothetical protein
MPRAPGWFAFAVPSLVASLVALAGACGGSTIVAAIDDGGASSDGTTSSDGGAASDAPRDTATTDDGAACVTVDPASFRHLCAADPDCTIIPTGTLCTGGCACGSASIAASDLPKFTAATAAIHTLACPCEYPGAPRCVQGTCTLCTTGLGGPAGCPDGG